ncbi:MAG: GNAT family N-acetyltransferase [Bacteroidales bacterium]|nr:GNAT family N-acetyltransferase [Bacteroidales bacterium]
MFTVSVANESHIGYISDILSAIFEASKDKANSIVMRDPDYLASKMREGKAVIALTTGEVPAFAGFCYIESWEHEKYVANSGLIVKPEFRGMGLASRIKQQIFQVCRAKFPDACIFSITKSKAVIKMNTALGFRIVPYQELTTDPQFWKGCETCPYYSTLLANRFRQCECVGLLFRPGLSE